MSNSRRSPVVTSLFLLFLILCMCVALCMGAFLFVAALGGGEVDAKDIEHGFVYGNEESENKLLTIKISGVILNDPTTDGGLFAEAGVYGYEIKEELMEAAEDDTIKGVILEIDSPGGTINGSNAISDGIKYYREETGNPIIAHCSGLCASGSYWVASATDYILADTGSLTGSIGVIYGPFKYYDGVVEEGSFLGKVVTQNGIETKFFTAGEYKDNGSPYRRLSEEEIKILQKGVDNEYDIFVKHVAETRDLTETKVRSEIKALVYDNKQAKTFGLIDDTANRHEAYSELAKRAELDEDGYKIVKKSRRLTAIERFLFTETENEPAKVESNEPEYCKLCMRPLFMYGDPFKF